MFDFRRLVNGNTWTICTYNNPPVTASTPPWKKGNYGKKAYTQRGVHLDRNHDRGGHHCTAGFNSGPNYLKSRAIAQRTTCVGNLRQIDGAIQSWALEARKQAGQPVTAEDIKGYLRNQVSCPSGGTSFADSYQLSTVEEAPVCLRVTSGEYLHKLPF